MASRGHHLLRADRRFATAAVSSAVSPPRRPPIVEAIRPAARAGRHRRDLARRKSPPRRLPRAWAGGGASPARLLPRWSGLALSGSVGWYKAWEKGEWSSPDPVKVFEVFAANAVTLGKVGRAKGPFRLANAIAHRLRDNGPRTARLNISAHYDLGNDFYSAWLDETMTYSSAKFSSDPFVEPAAQVGGRVSTSLDTNGDARFGRRPIP